MVSKNSTKRGFAAGAHSVSSSPQGWHQWEYLLQRLYSTFPSGSPGLGLLMLRAAVGLAAVVAGFFYFSGPAAVSAGRWVLGLLLVGSGAALEAGFLTPLMGSLVGACFLGIGLSWFPAPPIETSTEKILALGIVVAAASLALLGPGAFSLDGRLFGRREIVIPASRPHEK